MNRLRVVVAAVLLLVGCSESKMADVPPPLEPDKGSIGYICNMNLLEHAGPKGQIHVAGEMGPLWFSSVRDAFSYWFLEGATRKILVFYVNDMSDSPWERPAPGSWMEAQRAFYVLGSRQVSGMGGQEAVPFRDQVAAERFAAQHGGRVVPFAGVTKEIILAPPEEPTGHSGNHH